MYNDIGCSQHIEWENKVWGRVLHVCAEISCLEVHEGYQCSRHYHTAKRNTFIVVSGSLLILEWTERLVGSAPTNRTVVHSGQAHTVGVNVNHRFCVIESGVVIEYYSAENKGQQVRADDIVRIDEGGNIPDSERNGYGPHYRSCA